MYVPNPDENHDPWMNKDTPWRDKETFRRLWFNDQLTIDEIADEFGCSTWTINTWRKEHGLEGRREKFGKWKDKERLEKLYWGERLSTNEIAERVGCTQPTVSRWLREFDIPRRNVEQKHGSLTTTKDGYVYYNGASDIVWMHQLLAIAKGNNASDVFSKEYNTHHKNEIPYDNRAENVESIPVAEHTERHREQLIEARHG